MSLFKEKPQKINEQLRFPIEIAVMINDISIVIKYPSYPVGVYNEHMERIVEIITREIKK